MKTIAFYTLGCRSNQYETEFLKSRTAFEVVDFKEPADIYFINTCLVTLDAERKSRQAIRRALRQNPKAKVYVTGCYSELQKEKLKELFGGKVILIDNRNKLDVKELIKDRVEIKFPGKVRAALKIQDGCDNFCAYCVVPYARNSLSSKPLKEAVGEAKDMAAAGIKEIVLTGINLGLYEYDLNKIIDELSKIEGILRIRLSSIEPMYVTEKLVKTIAQNPKACDFLHIPLQTGDDALLKSMGRNYKSSDYLELVDLARKYIPDCGISTDIIVGLPGETESAFKNTLTTVKKANFSRVHIFPYSKRPGTKAAQMPDQVSEKEKKKRFKVLEHLRNEQMKAFTKKIFKHPQKILIEQRDRKSGKLEGLTSNYIRCFTEGPDSRIGSFVTIKQERVDF